MQRSVISQNGVHRQLREAALAGLQPGVHEPIAAARVVLQPEQVPHFMQHGGQQVHALRADLRAAWRLAAGGDASPETSRIRPRSCRA